MAGLLLARGDYPTSPRLFAAVKSSKGKVVSEGSPEPRIGYKADLFEALAPVEQSLWPKPVAVNIANLILNDYEEFVDGALCDGAVVADLLLRFSCELTFKDTAIRKVYLRFFPKEFTPFKSPAFNVCRYCCNQIDSLENEPLNFNKAFRKDKHVYKIKPTFYKHYPDHLTLCLSASSLLVGSGVLQDNQPQTKFKAAKKIILPQLDLAGIKSLLEDNGVHQCRDCLVSFYDVLAFSLYFIGLLYEKSGLSGTSISTYFRSYTQQTKQEWLQALQRHGSVLPKDVAQKFYALGIISEKYIKVTLQDLPEYLRPLVFLLFTEQQKNNATFVEGGSYLTSIQTYLEFKVPKVDGDKKDDLKLCARVPIVISMPKKVLEDKTNIFTFRYAKDVPYNSSWSKDTLSNHCITLINIRNQVAQSGFIPHFVKSDSKFGVLDPPYRYLSRRHHKIIKEAIQSMRPRTIMLWKRVMESPTISTRLKEFLLKQTFTIETREKSKSKEKNQKQGTKKTVHLMELFIPFIIEGPGGAYMVRLVPRSHYERSRVMELFWEFEGGPNGLHMLLGEDHADKAVMFIQLPGKAPRCSVVESWRNYNNMAFLSDLGLKNGPPKKEMSEGSCLQKWRALAAQGKPLAQAWGGADVKSLLADVLSEYREFEVLPYRQAKTGKNDAD